MSLKSYTAQYFVWKSHYNKAFQTQTLKLKAFTPIAQ